MKMLVKALALSAGIMVLSTSFAATVVVNMYQTALKGTGPSIGTVTLTDSTYGMLIQPNLHGLSPGAHGFHVHTNPDCSNNGLAAGDHLDPQHTNQHSGPFNASGHLGDLPVLMVDKNGNTTTETLAPRLTVAQVLGHSLMIHANGDNYSDQPAANGGGGARIACGVIAASVQS